MGDACALLFVKSGGSYVDQSDGESTGAGDRGQCRSAWDDRFGREGSGGIHEEDGKTDADAAGRDGSRHCRGGDVLRCCSAVYYRAGAGRGWRAGLVETALFSWHGFVYRSFSRIVQFDLEPTYDSIRSERWFFSARTFSNNI